MNTQLQTFEESVKAKLKDIVADLIPEDRWTAIVEATVRDFEKNDLPKLVKAELTLRYQKVIAEEFNRPEWQTRWVDGQQQASVKVREMLIDAAPLILASMIGGMSQQVLYDFQKSRI